MKLIHRFTGSLLIAALLFTPLATLAAEGKKGLNAVDVKVTRQEGDPIPDIDISIDQSPGGREMVLPGDNVRARTEKDRGIGHTIIIKSVEQLPTIEIGLPRTKGTVKFFNEAKRVGGEIIDVLIRVNGRDVCWPCSF